MSNEISSAGESDPAPSPGDRGKSRRWLWGLLALLLVGGGVVAWQVDWTSTPALFRQARLALEAKQYTMAERLGRRLMSREARQVEGTLIVAEALRNTGRFDEALAVLDKIPASDVALYVLGRLLTAQIQSDELHHLSAAEEPLREALNVDPQSIECHEKLTFILGLSGRTWEAIPHRLMLIQQEQFPLHHLSLLSLGSTAAENPDLVEAYAKTATDDALVKCAQARIARRDGKVEKAEKLLDEVIQLNSKLCAAQAWRGELLVDRHDAAGLEKWHSKLPQNADDFPDIWFVRGLWASQRGEERAAARCFWECLRRDPCQQTASHHLGNLLAKLGDQQSAEVFRKHTKLLNDLITAAKTVEISGSAMAKRKAAEAADALGLRWEAWAWRDILRRTDPRARLRAETHPRPPDDLPRMDPAFEPTRRVNLASYPLPAWTKSEATPIETSPAAAIGDSPIAFVEQAQAIGIQFNYLNGSRKETESEYMYEFSGGGVAVLDYDRDGWPDLYLTQGADNPPYQQQEKYLDVLYRNQGNGRLIDITTASRLYEPGFSQGCTVGDFDSDGFPDLYVANIGGNRFFRNNGDGTFMDITNATETAGDRWTTSCVLADFNGDGHPDIFTANYLTGTDLFTRPCRMPDGSTRLCTPHEFTAAHDQLWINLGDGRFEDQSKAAGIEVPEGKGLGVVAGSFDESGRLSLFIANDAVPNFFFANTTTPRGGSTRFEEQAFIAGLAVDGDGQPQACMGVAAGDANGDGLLDLLVTNFRNESNALYVQQPGGGFIDATRESGLREPSFPMLGFGTQFLDADLDGWEDLVVTNGHVGNLKHHGVPYEMEPQFFRNLGNAKFVELPAKMVGPFFAGKYLGRGLARVDWNRDGRDDFAICHLKSPFALLTNTTPALGNFLAVQLCGTDADRDAIGTSVTVTAGGKKFVKQLTAGDGYQASNQRQLVFGLGHADHIDGLEVRWPTGQRQVFDPITINSAVLLIEGRTQAYRLPDAAGK